jgi:hypothetical protein
MAKAKNIKDLQAETLPKSRKHLKTVRQCRSFLSKVTNDLYLGEISESKAGRLAYVVNILLRAIETEDIRNKVIDLEERVNEAFGKKGKIY